MGKIHDVTKIAQLYYEVAERCGVKTELSHSESGKLFRRLAATFKENPGIYLKTYLEAQFFMRPGKHLNVACVGSEQSKVAHHYYGLLSFVKYKRPSLLYNLRLDAAFIKGAKYACHTDSIREALLCRKPDSNIVKFEDWILTNMIGPAFLSISRSYSCAYRTMKDCKKYFPNPKDLHTIRWLIMVTKDLREYCERNFGDECNF